jgi:hypothetical protein
MADYFVIVDNVIQDKIVWDGETDLGEGYAQDPVTGDDVALLVLIDETNSHKDIGQFWDEALAFEEYLDEQEIEEEIEEADTEEKDEEK